MSRTDRKLSRKAVRLIVKPVELFEKFDLPESPLSSLSIRKMANKLFGIITNASQNNSLRISKNLIHS
jgi:hypothetical protein